ncbi:hypothetical protein KI387_041775, partial [Taxus chinensis]
TPEIQNLLCEFYLHNMIVTNVLDFLINLFVGDFQIKAFQSALRNQIIWGQQTNIFNHTAQSIGFHIHPTHHTDVALRKNFHSLYYQAGVG